MRKFAASIALSGLLVAPFAAQPPATPAPAVAKKGDKGKIDPVTQKCIDRGLEWLAKQQQTDGSFGDSRYPHNTAITGFVLLSFLSQGHVPNQGKYGPEVAKATRFLLASMRETDGYIVGSRGGNMYCHGMATLALSQLWGMSGDDEVKKALKKAVDLIVRSQGVEGGWRYQPSPTDSDISVTIMQVMALRGAKDSGLFVPEKTMNRALEYINQCYDKNSGGYSYQPGSGPGFARTSAGVCVVKLSGKYEQNVDKSVAYILEHMERPTDPHFWYGHYYASHALHQVGGKPWEAYYAFISKKFAEVQEENGSWGFRYRQEVGPVYHTAIACIALSVPADYLPIFQR